MGKALAHLLIFAAVFFGLWSLMSNVSWMKTFHIQEFTKEKQEQIAELLLKLQRADKNEIETPEVVDKINKIRDILCEKNDLDASQIQMHVFEDEVVNAFALPGGHIVVNTGLIEACDSIDMLAGVLAHELAHVQLSHVSRKLSREIGMSTILMMSGGGENLGALKKILNTLSSRSFDRDMEREADKQAIKYMIKANGDPRQLAYFLEDLTKEQADMPEAFQWMSTHPGGTERVDYILKDSPKKTSATGVLSKEEFAELKAAVEKIGKGEY